MEPELDRLMQEALREAEKGFLRGEVPVGAVVAERDGRILSRAHNSPISMQDPTAHAEILAIRRACSLKGNYRLPDTLLVVTVEPCLMCMAAAIHARVRTLAFGAYDPRGGAAGSLYDLSLDQRLNHRLELVSGIRQEACRDLMQRFFRVRRRNPQC